MQLSHPLRVQVAVNDRGAVNVSKGTVFGSPWITLPTDTLVDSIKKVDNFRCWLCNGPTSPHFSAESGDWSRWGKMVMLLPQLRGMRLADNVPLHVPSHADVLAEIANADSLPTVGVMWAHPSRAATLA